MPTSPTMSLTATATDAELVSASQAGDRDAFGRIVERYQRLLCSLAYAATGRVSESEDLAQEAFIEAWKHMGDLREPEKLRPWLCGIVRHRIGRLHRTDGREPVRQAGELDDAADISTQDEPAVELAMKGEEEAILWSELQRVPVLYREPMILYYREHSSIEHVAAALDLTEDTVKQRLARGRKILQERVLAFVESALARSTPGRVFTLGVLAALPQLAPPAKAAGLGAAALAAHGSTLAKTTTIAALLASITGVINAVLALRASLDQSRTPRERRAVVVSTIWCFFGSLGFIFLIWLLREAAFRAWEYRAVFAIAAQVLVLTLFTAWPFLIVRMIRGHARLRSEERRRHPELFRDERDQPGSSASEYRSRLKLFGVPLVHIRFSTVEEGQRPIVAWIAGGDRAIGLIAAWGGWAVAPISVGAFSVGLLSVGALSFGVISLGTFAVGGLAIGTLSVGVRAFAWLSALGWDTAQGGGFGIARLAAEAPIAFARHANDPVARQFLADPNAERNQMIFFIVIVLFSLVPVAAYARAVRRRLGPRRGGS